MSRYNYVTEVLQSFGEEMGMGPLEFDDTDRLSLTFDDVLVTLAYSSDPVELIWVYVDLGEVPPESLQVPQQLLQVAFECWANNLMTIGLDEEGKNAVGYSSIPVTVLVLPLLREVVRRILEAATLVREHVARTAFDEAQQPSAAMGQEATESPEAVASHAGWEQV